MMDVKIEVKGLQSILKALKNNSLVGRIGVLGSNAARTSDDEKSAPTNAEIGAAHEYGAVLPNGGKLPERSFLRMPLIEHLNSRLEDIGLTDKDVIHDVIASKNMRPWLEMVLVEAEGVVMDAFDSGGFGKWEPSDMKYKTNHQTLVETGQLRNAITSDVQES